MDQTSNDIHVGGIADFRLDPLVEFKIRISSSRIKVIRGYRKHLCVSGQSFSYFKKESEDMNQQSQLLLNESNITRFDEVKFKKEEQNHPQLIGAEGLRPLKTIPLPSVDTSEGELFRRKLCGLTNGTKP